MYHVRNDRWGIPENCLFLFEYSTQTTHRMLHSLHHNYCIRERRASKAAHFSRSKASMYTKNEYIGLAPDKSAKSDYVCVLLGGGSPYVLRPLENSYYKLIGEWYASP